MEEAHDPRSLVCYDCWTLIFSRDEYRAICHSMDEKALHSGPRYTILFEALRDSAASGCSWCSFVLSWILQAFKVVPLPDQTLSIEFVSFMSRRHSSPVGNNGVMILIDGTPLFGTIFVGQDSGVGDIVTARDVRTQINSDEASSQILEWLLDCDGHAVCPRIMPSKLPTRVIDVSPALHPEKPRLVETNGGTDHYVALSYCWGSNQTGLTTTSNLEPRKQQLELRELSQSARDAITVTRSLGIKYLWIDAICILQDSASDKVIELGSMCRIYQQATVTIVAASATSASQGFLEDRVPPRPAVPIPFWTPDDSLTSVFLRPEQLYNDENEPINSRAWTLQEQLLSPRLLIYATHTLQYQCHEHTVNLGDSVHAAAHLESRSFLKDSDGIQEAIRDQVVGRGWVDIVRMYSQRNLSFPKDKLTALAGIAEAFSSHNPGDYIAGLWSGEILARLLLWDISPNKNYATSSTYVAPSWSWASLDCPVFYHHFHHQHNFKLYNFDIVSWHVVMDNEALPFGSIGRGDLTIDGYVCSGYFRGPRSFTWSLLPEANVYSVAQGMTPLLDDPKTQNMDVKCLAIARRTFEGGNMKFTPVIDGLIISNVKLVGSNMNNPQYRRIGTFHGLSEMDTQSFRPERLTLV